MELSSFYPLWTGTHSFSVLRHVTFVCYDFQISRFWVWFHHIHQIKDCNNFILNLNLKTSLKHLRISSGVPSFCLSEKNYHCSCYLCFSTSSRYHQILIGVLWEIVVHSNASVRCCAAPLFTVSQCELNIFKTLVLFFTVFEVRVRISWLFIA